MTAADPEITLYAAAQSLYSGRARSYLIKAGISYREKAPIDDHFASVVLPKAGGQMTIPMIETQDGLVVRDGAAIIDHFEASSGHRFSPATPKQNLISRLFDVIGAEGLLRPAMHYRWDYPEENLPLLNFHFESLMPRGPGRSDRAKKVADRMRMASQFMGVTAQSQAVIQTHYGDVMQALDRHFAAFPYLLGGRPSIGDFGMIAPLYGHLGRDPKPLSMMTQTAVHLFRWVERMNRPEPDISEFDDSSEAYLAGDTIPETLINALSVLAEDFLPETLAAAETINAWLAETNPVPGTPIERVVGTAQFKLRGVDISAIAQPYRFYLLKRVQDAYAALGSSDQSAVDDLLEACNLGALMDARINRDIGRNTNLETWI
ncbi:MAG: glutathione S-transferase N-terminal domain-containing protein [Pseudomonadota bacterium]